MRNITLCIIVALIASVSCGKKDKKKDPGKTAEVAAVKVTVVSLAELINGGKTAEFVKQLAQLTAISVNDPVDASGVSLAMLAARKGDLEALKALVEKAARLDLADKGGATLLHAGAAFLPVVQFLLEKKVDPDKTDLLGRTPAHAAIELGRCDVMNALLAAGASQNARDKQGASLLHLAAAQPEAACLEGLLERKANVNAADEAGLTPVLWAARAGNLAALERLAKAGSSLIKKTKRGDSALHLAVEAKTLDVLKFLVEKKKQYPDAKNTQGQTPLHAAALAGAGEAVTYLLSKKAYPGAKDKDGRIPLHAAAGRGQLAVVKLLLEKKSWLDNTDFKKRTPLFLAIMNGRIEVATFLVAQGASLTLADAEGFSALHHAIIAGNEALTTAIIEKSGKIDVPTKSGWTALHLAASRGQEKMVKLLVDKGANVSAKDRKGNHPYHLAMDDTPPMFPAELDELRAALTALPATEDGSHLKAAIAWLEEQKKEDEALRSGRILCAKLLLEKNSDLSARDHSGRDALQLAAASGMKELFDLLKGKGLLGDKPDFRSRTLLYHAAMGGNLEIVKAVMDMGATEVVFKYNRETPLHVAAQFNRVEVIGLFIGKGASVKAKATNGDTVLMYAARSLAVQAAAALFEAGAEAVAPASGEAGPAGARVRDDEEDFRPPSGDDGEYAPEEEAPPAEDPEGANPEKGDENPSKGTEYFENHLKVLPAMDGTALDVVFRAALDNQPGTKGRSPRATVLLRRQLGFLELLFGKGTSTEVLVEGTALMVNATLSGHLELCQLLLKHKDQWKVLKPQDLPRLAVSEKHFALAKYFLDQGFLPEEGPGNRALLKAILEAERPSERAAALDVFTKLLPLVKDLDEADDAGNTLLHTAVENGSADFVQALMTAKPSLSKTNQDGETPVHVAVRLGRLKLVELFLGPGATKVPEGDLAFVPLAAGSGSVEVLQWLLKNGYKDQETAGDKVSGLFAAAQAGNWSAFQLLSGGRTEALKATDARGATIAHYAAAGGSEKILNALLKAGIPFTVADSTKTTPLHVAVKAKKEGAIAWLLKNGADPAAVDDAGKKPADYADEAIKPLLP